MQQVVSGLNRRAENRQVPVVIFTKGGGLWLEQLAQLGADALGTDWTVNLQQARQRVGTQVALQGNLDPLALFGSQDCLELEIERLLAEYGHGSGHVFNLGHGINQYTDPEQVAFMVEAVHRISVRYHTD